MTAQKREITRDDILPLETYAAQRKERRTKSAEMKRTRRLGVGAFCTFYFENYDTMFQQIHEMLYIEKGGEEQIADELAAYNPLIPNGRELVATVMFEINDPVQRDKELRRLAHVEDFMFVDIGGERAKAVPEQDVERTTADGKTSSVHFLHFPLTDEQAAKFKDPSVEVSLVISHENYGHIAMIPKDVREALAGDLA
ncbi:hypothetical protein FHS78_002457 [Parvibaculum indicum]|uniref:DUF3501 family protein n=1 Tax=Parvibaculum indicum TaxID=562969 RepID=UPI0014238A63|nr:DUF3501 family protein [Parvibaculum indicum]NIJ42164.1 hypothetical protein [Parvibaculum indicum]